MQKIKVPTDICTVPVLSQQEMDLGDDGLLGRKKTVRVQNDLNNGITVYLHCRSRDNDLGLHVLANGENQ
ncbi:hypothetical protein CR513_16816, partial [Mucuna pruriens]